MLMAIPCGLSAKDETSGWLDKGDYYQQIMKLGPIRFLKYTQDGRFLFSFGDDNKLRKWDVPTGSLIKEIAISAGKIIKIDISRDGGTYAYINNNLNISIFSFETNEPVVLGKAKYYEAPCWINPTVLNIDFAFHPAKDILIIAPTYEFQCPLEPGLKVYREGCFELYSSIDGSYINSILNGTGKFFLNFSPNGQYLTYSEYSGYYYNDYQEQTSWSKSERVIANSDLIPIRYTGYTVAIQIDGAYPVEHYPVFSPNSKLLAWFYNHRYYLLTAPYTGWQREGIFDEAFEISEIAFTPDSKNLLTSCVAGKNRYIQFFNPESGQSYYSIYFPFGPEDWIFAHSPDSLKLTSGSSDGYIRIYKDDISIPIKAAFSPGKYIININDTVGFFDYSVGRVEHRIWDFGDGTMSNAQNPEHIYLNAGKYTVSLIIKNNFISDTLIQKNLITVKNTTDVLSDKLSENRLTISPNPASGYIEISGLIKDDKLFDEEIQIYNLLGQLVSICIPEGGQDPKIDVSQLQPGLYLLRANKYYSMFQKI